ncbi:MAG: hypothetical protein ACTHJ8_05645 [Mucilaginibacter sp.]|jgi:hypothetical protein
MTLVELKKSIHQKVDNLDDLELLELINQLAHKKDDIFIIPQNMKEGIRQGEQDIKNGDIFSMEDFEKKYEQWLKG